MYGTRRGGRDEEGREQEGCGGGGGYGGEREWEGRDGFVEVRSFVEEA